MPSADVNRTVEAVWRIESGRLIAGLARMTGDVGLAEDLAQEALVAALESWSRDGVPPNPGAWLMTTAKNRAIDGMRRAEHFERRRRSSAGISSCGGLSRRRTPRSTRSATTCSA